MPSMHLHSILNEIHVLFYIVIVELCIFYECSNGLIDSFGEHKIHLSHSAGLVTTIFELLSLFQVLLENGADPRKVAQDGNSPEQVRRKSLRVGRTEM